MTREKYLENICHEANSYIGLARLALSQGDAAKASSYLDQYCEEHDRIEVRYLGYDKAKELLDSGIIHPTPAFADEITKLEQERQRQAAAGLI